MADILHDFPVFAPPARVFDEVSTPEGIARWWALGAGGTPAAGSEYALDFGPDYQWRARVSAFERGRLFELEMTDAMHDWMRSRVRFELDGPAEGPTQVRFSHTGWPGVSEHYRVSTFCWAMYLRLMKRSVEAGEFVPYERRLDV